MPVERLYFVSQVAPYLDGPAGVHGVLDQAATAIAELALMEGLQPVHVRDVAGLSAKDLRQPGVLGLFTIGETPWTNRQRAAILEGVGEGRLSVVALHAATDSCHGWDDYLRLVGARFDGHPWTQHFEIDVLDRSHPATSHLGAGWSMKDEVYLFRELRADAHVLLQAREDPLDMSAPGARRPECGFPLSWCFEEGDGRVFYTALGHFPSAWESPAYLRHVAGGLAWARGAR